MKTENSKDKESSTDQKWPDDIKNELAIFLTLKGPQI